MCKLHNNIVDEKYFVCSYSFFSAIIIIGPMEMARNSSMLIHEVIYLVFFVYLLYL